MSGAKYIIGNRNSGKSVSILTYAHENKCICITNFEQSKMMLKRLASELNLDVPIYTLAELSSLRGANMSEYQDSNRNFRVVIDESKEMLQYLLNKETAMATKIEALSDTGNLEIRAGQYVSNKVTELDSEDYIAVVELNLDVNEEL